MEMFRKISELKPGEEVKVRGWVYRARSSKQAAFIILRDSTGIVQCVFQNSKLPERIFSQADSVPIESSVIIEGKVREDERAPTGLEIDAKQLQILHKAERFPITKDHSERFLLDLRHLWVRSRKLTNVFKIKSTMFQAAREYLIKEGFYETQSPIITSSACEGGTTLFKFNFFGNEAYMSQSGQLYSEALIFSLEKVFCFAPSFRAEKSRTRRHLAEYWHLEPEMAWYDHEDNIKLQKKLLTYICNKIASKNKEELLFLGRNPKDLKNLKFNRITYEKAIKILQNKGFKIKYGDDFGANEEFSLTNDSKKALIIEKFPLEIKAFYMKADTKNPELALCNDVLAPEGYGEIIGASERETDNSLLIKRLKKEGANLENYKWYLDLRKYGSVPHSGFGMGMERVLRWICKLDHIRDAIPFPRMMNRYYP